MEITALSPSTRRGLQVASVLIILAGAVLMVMTVADMFGGPSPGDADFESAAREHMASLALTGFGGVVLLGIGGALAYFAFLKVTSEIVASEVGGAVTHIAGRASAGWNRPQQVKLKCRSCGFLDSEDANFCSDCGEAM